MEEEIKVIYEDSSILVIDKPAGLVTTWDKNLKSVEEWLRKDRQNGLEREGIVHRLDRGTSGILLVAKTEMALVELKRQFKNRETTKKYWALVGGEAVGGKLEMPIGRSRYQFARFGVQTEGKMAITEFRVIKNIRMEEKIYSLMEVNLKTGRTHQIRVHFSYLGWPLLGDRLYGGKLVEGINRPFLHAVYLKIKHPKTEKTMEFNSELAVDLKKILQKYE